MLDNFTIDNDPGQRVVDLQRSYLDGVGAHIGSWHRLDSEADTCRSNFGRLVVQRLDAILEVRVSDESLTPETTKERQRVLPSKERYLEIVGDVASWERPQDRHVRSDHDALHCSNLDLCRRCPERSFSHSTRIMARTYSSLGKLDEYRQVVCF